MIRRQCFVPFSLVGNEHLRARIERKTKENNFLSRRVDAVNSLGNHVPFYLSFILPLSLLVEPTHPSPFSPSYHPRAGHVVARKASRKRRQTAETRWAQPGRAKTCKIMQIAFVRTSHPPPLIPVPPSRHTAASRWLPPIPGSCLSRSRGPLFLVVSPFLHHPLSTRISLLFSSSAPLHQPAHLRDSALRSLARSLAPSRNIHFPPRPQTSVDLSRARESERQKCFDDCVPWRLFLYFCRGGGIPGWAGLLPPPPPPPPPRIGG